ncbi:hypothetical protein C8Q76DRAFT_685857 [Earliella scabrosa]|nr:hypothetical protein C8Q76DRAFT_685857 [Earliella scabrosa]
MATDTRPAKRMRVLDSSSASFILKGLKSDDEFWLDDGNVILVAGDTAFRVYRGLLESQSTVFQDMFASSSAIPDESYRDCPIVHLTDGIEDLRDFLRVLLPRRNRNFYRSSPYSFDEVYAVIRLAHKYNVEDVQAQALDALRTWWTDDFETWCSESDYPVDTEMMHAIGIVNIARLTDTPSFLPLAFYHCRALGGALFDGWTRRDGTVEHVSKEDIRRCLEGRDRLAKASISHLYRIFTPTPNHMCTTYNACTSSLGKILARAMMQEDAGSATLLGSWEGPINDYTDYHPLCAACKQGLLDRDVDERRNLWNKLPGIFDLSIDGWGAEKHEEASAQAEE